MQRYSHREYLLRLNYVEEQWNEPSRSDYYAMQIAAEIRGVLRKRIPKLSLFKIPFEWSGQSKKPKMSKEQASALAKSKWLSWLGAFGGKGKKPTVVQKLREPESSPD